MFRKIINIFIFRCPTHYIHRKIQHSAKIQNYYNKPYNWKPNTYRDNKLHYAFGCTYILVCFRTTIINWNFSKTRHNNTLSHYEHCHKDQMNPISQDQIKPITTRLIHFHSSRHPSHSTLQLRSFHSDPLNYAKYPPE